VTVDASSRVDAVAEGHVRLAWALKQTAQYAIGLIPRDAVIGPAEHVLTAERLRVHITDVAMISVMLDRARGAPWALIARHRGIPRDEAERLYQPLYERWLAGEAYPWHPPGVTNMPMACPDDLRDAASQLNDWYDEVSGPLGRSGYGRRRRPVSCVFDED
jgi:hypothetical protein